MGQELVLGASRYECWKPKLGPLQEQYMFLSTEPTCFRRSFREFIIFLLCLFACIFRVLSIWTIPDLFALSYLTFPSSSIALWIWGSLLACFTRTSLSSGLVAGTLSRLFSLSSTGTQWVSQVGCLLSLLCLLCMMPKLIFLVLHNLFCVEDFSDSINT